MCTSFSPTSGGSTCSTDTDLLMGLVCLPTCSQDVSCHPEGGQSADHCASPQTGHELREVGEDNRDGPADPAEEEENSFNA